MDVLLRALESFGNKTTTEWRNIVFCLMTTSTDIILCLQYQFRFNIVLIDLIDFSWWKPKQKQISFVLQSPSQVFLVLNKRRKLKLRNRCETFKFFLVNSFVEQKTHQSSLKLGSEISCQFYYNYNQHCEAVSEYLKRN